MNPADQPYPAPLPSRWKLGCGWFLMVCSGASYETDLVRGEDLADAWEVACWGEVGGAPEDVRRETEARLADPDCWYHDGDNGPTRFQEDVGETDTIAFFRLPDFKLVGALASHPDAPDPAPECPMQHVLHPSFAGVSPVLLFAQLPMHLAKLGQA